MRLYQFLHQLCAVVEAVDESFAFIGYTDPAAEVEYRIVVIQGQDLQVILQFFESFSDARWIVFMGFRIGSVQLIQHSFTIRIAGVKSVALNASFQQL